MEETLESVSNYYRSELKKIEDHMRLQMNADFFKNEQAFNNQHSEVKANIMLVVRHLEDARMRLGKVLQYAKDGISILDK